MQGGYIKSARPIPSRRMSKPKLEEETPEKGLLTEGKKGGKKKKKKKGEEKWGSEEITTGEATVWGRSIKTFSPITVSRDQSVKIIPNTW